MGGRGGSSHRASAGGGSPAFDFLRRAYGANHANAVLAILQNAPEHIRSMWDDFSSQFRATRMGRNERSAFYAPADDSVHLNISSVARGDVISTPYSVLFHEYGHMTDYLIARSEGHGRYSAYSELFEQAMNDYYAHFGAPYPYAVGIGFKGETDEENIRIIQEAIANNTPVVITPDYESGQDY